MEVFEKISYPSGTGTFVIIIVPFSMLIASPLSIISVSITLTSRYRLDGVFRGAIASTLIFVIVAAATDSWAPPLFPATSWCFSVSVVVVVSISVCLFPWTSTQPTTESASHPVPRCRSATLTLTWSLSHGRRSRVLARIPATIPTTCTARVDIVIVDIIEGHLRS